MGNKLAAIVPDLGEFYTADQMEDLAMGAPVLQAQPDGTFILEFCIEESTGLETWELLPLALDDLSVVTGKINVTIQPAASGTRFLRLLGR